MDILVFTEYLFKGLYTNEQVKKNARWLYETIVKKEVLGGRAFVKKEKSPTVNIKHDSRPKPPTTPNEGMLQLKNL